MMTIHYPPTDTSNKNFNHISICAKMIVRFGWIDPIIRVLFPAPLEIELAPTEQFMRTGGKSGRRRPSRPIQSVPSPPLNTVYNGARLRK